jgi:hypothetical protein
MGAIWDAYPQESSLAIVEKLRVLGPMFILSICFVFIRRTYT